ncbi:PREDICTED: uncharacterized protein LOC104791679 [Camelina sativa]|uniref:Uncharacterized protein LOC104791679 n=1 Tax=Camelina sativa TaxID=90675 RepID=A0ABM0ZHS7_CAMSA|nr:PREDICTED: uncharacterized protein LOC104791679 [Camelina sativa]
MASFSLSRSLLVLLLIVISLFSTFSLSEATSFTFSFTSSNKNASFESQDIALFGDAKLVDNGSSVQLTDSVIHGGGRVVYKKPIESVKNIGNEYFAGFSTVFSFSMSPGGGRLGFVVFPVNGTFDHSLFQVKFDTSDKFTKFGDPSVAVIVDGATVPEMILSFKMANLVKTEKVLLYAWINYQAGGKFLEVRLSKSKSFESVLPLVFDRIDLSAMLKYEDEFMVGVNSYSGNVNLHSWSLEVRRSEYEHSWAVVMVEELEKKEAVKKRRKERIWEIVTCFVMTFGSTGLIFFAMMHIWAAFKRNNLAMVMQEECGIKTKEFGYEKMEKMEVVMSKANAKQEAK